LTTAFDNLTDRAW